MSEFDDDLSPINIEDSDTTTVRTETETHIGVEKKSGGWLEKTCADILEFAGFDTQREVKINFVDDTSDHFRIDVLAKYNELTIFLESKDYNEIKVDPKILFTLIGQINHYRLEHPQEKVIGILVTSAKNVNDANYGISQKLEAEGCYLWDGFQIQDFKDKIKQFRNGNSFRRYLLEKIQFEVPSSKALPRTEDGTQFFCRLDFYSIIEKLYIGNTFNEYSILSDIKNSMKDTKISLHRVNFGLVNLVASNRIHFVCDFVMTKTNDEILRHSHKHRGNWFRRNKLKPTELMEFNFSRACLKVLENTYGVENPLHSEFGCQVVTTRCE